MDIDQTGYAWFISRGTELCDVSDGVCKYILSYLQ